MFAPAGSALASGTKYPHCSSAAICRGYLHQVRPHTSTTNLYRHIHFIHISLHIYMYITNHAQNRELSCTWAPRTARWFFCSVCSFSHTCTARCVCAHTTWQFVGSLGQQRCTPDVSHPCMMITRLLMSGPMSVVDQMGT